MFLIKYCTEQAEYYSNAFMAQSGRNSTKVYFKPCFPCKVVSEKKRRTVQSSQSIIESDIQGVLMLK